MSKHRFLQRLVSEKDPMDCPSIDLVYKLRPTSIVVVGDIMLDQFITGIVERVSPEAPVEIFEQRTLTQVPGGAANVACGIAALGGQVVLCGILGNDIEGDTLIKAVEDRRVSASYLIRTKDRHTTVKARLVAQGHQILRIDREHRHPICMELAEQIMDKVAQHLPVSQALVLSDYNKGALLPSLVRRVIAIAKEHGIPVIVDPKSSPLDHFAGADIIKPNFREFTLAVEGVAGEDDFYRKAERMRTNLNASALLVTRGAEGMVLFQASHLPKEIPALRKEVYDVTGAGDTVTAIMSVGMASGMQVEDAAQLANVAASLAVCHWGTAIIQREDIIVALNGRSEQNDIEKIYPLDLLSSLIGQLKLSGKRIVFTNGCFDLLHVGHITLLEKARQLGDILVVGINSDDSVRRLKGNTRPLVKDTDRARMLASMKTVDYVTIFEEDSPVKVIEIIQPDVHVKGSDYADGRAPMPEKAVVESYGGVVHFVPLVRGYSTTQLLRQTENGNSIDRTTMTNCAPGERGTCGLEGAYREACATPSDIHEHLPVLRHYATGCQHVTEVGVREVVSTWAFLAAHPAVVECYDLNHHPNIDKASKMAQTEGVRLKFQQQNILHADIAETDLLFIDSFHTGEQLRAELARHEGKVHQWIILHDTETFGQRGEDGSTGLIPAIEEFLENNIEWKLEAIFTNCHGLMVLRRYTPSP